MKPKGGAREGAGRKTKAEELGLPAMIDEVAGIDGKKEVLKKVLEQAKGGSYNHQQLFLAYAYGKPVEKVDLGGGLVIQLTRKVVK